MTALGLITLFRVYFSCSACKLGGYSADALVGLGDYLSKAARRVVCFVACNNSFAATSGILHEACGWTVSDQHISDVCYQEGARIEAWMAGDGEEQAYRKFLDAAGKIEVEIDAAKVNTCGGWRDIKIGIFAKREPGEKASPEHWEKRKLPRPTARQAFATMEQAQDFSERTRELMPKLGVVDTDQVSVLGDGAEWIWNLAKQRFPGAFEVLDVFHALERIGTAAKQLHGEGTEETKQWQGQTLHALLADGWWGLCGQIGKTLEEMGEKAETPMGELVEYFSKHTSRLNYCARLYGGRTIGSGMVEGACKNLIGKRLKQTKARWVVENVERMAVLCCSHYSETWSLYWTAA